MNRALIFFVLLYIAAGFVHHAHNAEFLADYPNMPAGLTQGGVYVAWLVEATLGLGGYALWRGGYRLTGLATMAVCSALGLDGLGHYVLAPLSAHAFGMNMTILFEVTTGALLLTAVAVCFLQRYRTRGGEEQ